MRTSESGPLVDESGNTQSIGSIIKASRKLLPEDMQDQLMDEMHVDIEASAAPAGAILMGVHVLDYLGFSKHIDDMVGETHTSLDQLREQYNNGSEVSTPVVPSTGTIMSLMVADMCACPRTITPAYKFVEMARKWKTGPLLGIEPTLLTDDRIGRCLSIAGANHKSMEEVLMNLVLDAGKKTGIPLNKFILDTTNLQLDGQFEGAKKVVPGRGKDSFSQLIVSLVIASGSRLPVGFGVLPGNTSDSRTLPGIYETVNKIADPGAIEFLMDRIYPTPSNLSFLQEKETERKVNWISPLKMGLSEKKVREEIAQAWSQDKWKPITYRSTKELKAQIANPLTAFETTWMLSEKIKPEIQPGQNRRPRGSITTNEITVRCVFYRHSTQAANEKERRHQKIDDLDHALREFTEKLNKRDYRETEKCEAKLDILLKGYASVKAFVSCSLVKSESEIITLTWKWDKQAIDKEEKYDGVFALMTNYGTSEINQNQLVSRYRSRDEVEVDFKAMRGLLDLERVLYQRQERIDAFIFMKVIALFVLAFMRSYAANEGVKTTEKQIQESMGDMLLVENRMAPLNLKLYSVARDTTLNQMFRKLFNLPEPTVLIRVLGIMEASNLDRYICEWYESKNEQRIHHSR